MIKLGFGLILLVVGLLTTTFGGFLLNDWWSDQKSADDSPSSEAAGDSQSTATTELSKQDRTIAALRDLGFGEPVWLEEVDNGASQRREAAALLSGPAITSTDNLVAQEIALVSPDGSKLLLRAMVLMNRHSWKKGENHLFEGETPQGISPVKAIPKAGVASDIKRSLKVYCIGLSSTEFRADQSDNNTVLSDDRAIRLCNALYELGYVKSDRAPSAIAAGLGEPNSPITSQTDPSRQRIALLVGVTEIGDEHTESDVIIAIIHGRTATGVKLENYRRSDGKLFMMFDVKDSKFNKSTSDLWDDTPGLTNRKAIK